MARSFNLKPPQVEEDHRLLQPHLVAVKVLVDLLLSSGLMLDGELHTRFCCSVETTHKAQSSVSQNTNSACTLWRTQLQVILGSFGA